MAVRKDTKGRRLKKGESQLKSGKLKGIYKYTWQDSLHKQHSIYSWRLVASDSLPKGKRPCDPLRDMIARLDNEILAGIDYSLRDRTLNDYHELATSNKSVRESTLNAIETAWKRVTIAERPVSQIKHSEVVRFLKDLHNEGLSPRYIQRIYGYVVEALELALQDDAVRKNVAKGAYDKLGLQTPGMKDSLTNEQENLLFSFMESNPDANRWLNMFTVAAWTGIRIGELLALTWNDVDFKENELIINKSLTYTKNRETGKMEKHITATKTYGSVRTIPMLNAVRSALINQKESTLFKQTEKIDGYSNFIFTNMYSKVYTQAQVFTALDRIVKRYNNTADPGKELPRMSPHTFRHTFATRLCEESNNLKFIQDVLGHASADMTLNFYAQCQKEKKHEEVKALDKAFRMA